MLHKYLHGPCKLLPNFCKNKFKIRGPQDQPQVQLLELTENSAKPLHSWRVTQMPGEVPGRGKGMCRGPVELSLVPRENIQLVQVV